MVELANKYLKTANKNIITMLKNVREIKIKSRGHERDQNWTCRHEQHSVWNESILDGISR